jgi:hypothetical protein
MKLREAKPPALVTSEAREFAALRRQHGIGLRDAAIKLEIRALEVSGLERGRLVPKDPGEWRSMMAVLAKHGG